MSGLDSDSLIGTELDEFRPLRVLGRGGMGVVYEAQDAELHRRVALKVLRPEIAEMGLARDRFRREIELAVAIEHPYVVPIYSAGFARQHFYIAMRLIAGQDLNKALAKHGFIDEHRALRIVGQVASALHAVHVKGLVHRDVKPHNVLLSSVVDGEEHALLTDFGIAKALDDTLHLTAGVIGTSAYMAPEVCLHQSASPVSDQYSLACMAYELLAGRLPFEGGSAEMRKAHVEQTPSPLAEQAPQVSASVAAAIDRALSKQPEHRYPDIKTFVKAVTGAEESFQRSQRIDRLIKEAARPEDAVEQLVTDFGLSNETVSHLTDLEETEIIRLRRRRARDALVGRRPR
jgi:serine/threonine protein kinase